MGAVLKSPQVYAYKQSQEFSELVQKAKTHTKQINLHYEHGKQIVCLMCCPFKIKMEIN